MVTGMIIRPYSPDDEQAVIDLWCRCNLVRPQNNPKLDIERKLSINPELFLVGLIDSKIVATVMGGYEGHRGWVNYLGVTPEHRKKGLGRQIMKVLEEKLKTTGCPKINLQVRNDNLEALMFYEKLGYKIDEVQSMGKRLVQE
jgi:ribosomal protein S18 acetylase RimI-like enzyme